MIKDLTVDRSAFDRIIQSGGYVSMHTGCAPEANNTLVEKHASDGAFNSAACIGCGACVAVCQNASATLFVAAKITHLAYYPKVKLNPKTGQKKLILKMQSEGFGSCANHRHCTPACPKDVSLQNITRVNKILG
ncbi:4Fe-4S dicluster domain-containing protein [Isorropodon fossajaponicum symbiont]|uniref:4Fe-4S dicluster domain-containing protein n=1 Tax=Isorropodon fossajaponicum symbiont TaxID=883811 RepID=UPI003CC92918